MADRDELLKRQRALAEFGEFVLRCDDLEPILTEACRLIADALKTEFAKIVEIEHDGDSGLIRAGVGWNEGIVGQRRLRLNERSSESYAIRQSEPVITRDIREEQRFEFPSFMKDHDVVAIVNVPIFLPGGEAYGLLQVDSRRRHDFDDDDIQFLRIYASLLGPVIDRLRNVGELKHAAERFQLIVENARDYAIFITDPNRVITDWLPGAAAVFGWREDEIVGKPAAVTFLPEDQASGAPEREFEHAREHGIAPDVRWHMRKDGSPVFIDGQTVTLRYPDRRVRGFMKIGQDVTNRRRDEERQSVLLAELQHRVRNVLAMVRSIINRGANRATVAEFRAELDGRVAALARTQALLTRGPDAGVDLEALVRDELLVHSPDEPRMNVAGPSVTLAAKAAEILTLAVHELATNAMKHGAFSQPAGHVDISWGIVPRGDDKWVELTWRESGVAVPTNAVPRKGFGTELVTRRVPYELGGRGAMTFEPDGLCCEIAFPLRPGTSTLQTNAPAAFRNANPRKGKG
jgi:PAS domain S-box-containing protein